MAAAAAAAAASSSSGFVGGPVAAGVVLAFVILREIRNARRNERRAKHKATEAQIQSAAQILQNVLGMNGEALAIAQSISSASTGNLPNFDYSYNQSSSSSILDENSTFRYSRPKFYRAPGKTNANWANQLASELLSITGGNLNKINSYQLPPKEYLMIQNKVADGSLQKFQNLTDPPPSPFIVEQYGEVFYVNYVGVWDRKYQAIAKKLYALGFDIAALIGGPVGVVADVLGILYSVAIENDTDEAAISTGVTAIDAYFGQIEKYIENSDEFTDSQKDQIVKYFKTGPIRYIKAADVFFVVKDIYEIHTLMSSDPTRDEQLMDITRRFLIRRIHMGQGGGPMNSTLTIKVSPVETLKYNTSMDDDDIENDLHQFTSVEDLQYFVDLLYSMIKEALANDDLSTEDGFNVALEYILSYNFYYYVINTYRNSIR